MALSAPAKSLFHTPVPDVALTISRLLEKHHKKIMPIELGTSEVALPDQGHVPGVLPVVTLKVLSNLWVKTSRGEEEHQEQEQRQQKGTPAGLETGGKLPVGLERASSGGTRTAKLRQLLAG